MNDDDIRLILAENERRDKFAKEAQTESTHYSKQADEYTKRFISQCTERIESNIRNDVLNGIKYSILAIDVYCGINYIPDFKHRSCSPYYGIDYKTYTKCKEYDEIQHRLHENLNKWKIPIKLTKWEKDKEENYDLDYKAKDKKCNSRNIEWKTDYYSR